jgi:hypothetical protein
MELGGKHQESRQHSAQRAPFPGSLYLAVSLQRVELQPDAAREVGPAGHRIGDRV